MLEPGLAVRQWRVVNDFANGPESWGMVDYRPVLDQLAKLKFNRILIASGRISLSWTSRSGHQTPVGNALV